MMVQAFVLALLTWTGTVRIWHVYLMALMLAAAQAIDLPARGAFIIDMVVDRDDLTNDCAQLGDLQHGAPWVPHWPARWSQRWAKGRRS